MSDSTDPDDDGTLAVDHSDDATPPASELFDDEIEPESVDTSGGDDPAGTMAPTPTPAPTAKPLAQVEQALRPTLRDRRAAGRLRARKVRRLVRHVEPWSVLKVSLIFYFCLWVILLMAGVILWSFAVTSGTVDNFENFIEELFALETFEFNADEIFRAAAIGGLVLVMAGAGFTVLMAVLFNLISDLTGGVRLTVVEEETARPRPKRTRPRYPARPAVGSPSGPSPEPLDAASTPADRSDAMPLLPTAEDGGSSVEATSRPR